jgi:type VI secretion system protein ImpF
MAMPPMNDRIRLLPSLLDRLLDPEEDGGRRGYSLGQMSEAVRRDLEDLLNTRRTVDEEASDFVEVSQSLLAYGMPELSAFNASVPREREELVRLVADIIARFEPRLRDVRVSLTDTGAANTPRVHFHIEARLAVESAPQVRFETVLDVPTGHAAVLPSET